MPINSYKQLLFSEQEFKICQRETFVSFKLASAISFKVGFIQVLEFQFLLWLKNTFELK